MITLTDVSPANLAWLGAAAAGIGADDVRGRWVWQPFWSEYARYVGYQQVADPRAQLAARHEVRQLDVLQLEPAGWDLGTMFFVAESMTECPVEFSEAATPLLTGHFRPSSRSTSRWFGRSFRRYPPM